MDRDRDRPRTNCPVSGSAVPSAAAVAEAARTVRAGTTITDIASIVNGMVSPLRGELTQDENDRIQVSYCWIQGTYYGFISLMSWRELASELREALAHADGVDQEEIRAQIADAEARARA